MWPRLLRSSLDLLAAATGRGVNGRLRHDSDTRPYG